jgi:hypothetical protein
VVDIETTLLQQLLNIAQRKRIAKIPPDRTKYEAGFSLPPFEDRGSGSHFAILSRHQPAALKVATHPARALLRKSLYARAGMERKEAFNFHAMRCDRVVKNVFERIQKHVSNTDDSAARMQ